MVSTCTPGQQVAILGVNDFLLPPIRHLMLLKGAKAEKANYCSHHSLSCSGCIGVTTQTQGDSYSDCCGWVIWTPLPIQFERSILSRNRWVCNRQPADSRGHKGAGGSPNWSAASLQMGEQQGRAGNTQARFTRHGALSC